MLLPDAWAGGSVRATEIRTGGPEAAGKFSGGLRSGSRISCSALPPCGCSVFPTLWAPCSSPAQMRSRGMDVAQSLGIDANL